MKHWVSFLCLLSATLTGCDSTKITGYRYNEGTLPAKPVNLDAVNSPDDDYNSDVPTFGEVIPLIFSSKRGGRQDFDFVNEKLDYTFNRRTGAFTFTNWPSWTLDVVARQAPLANAVSVANSPANELGPYIRSYDDDLIGGGFLRHNGQYLMLFASDRAGSLDIYLTENYEPASQEPMSKVSTRPFSPPVPVKFLNSSADDAYPTFDKAYQSLYFTSNRAGTFDIYRASVPEGPRETLHRQLAEGAEAGLEKVAALSSGADDKCPYILGDILVFTSNRPGGQGGFDLYYSRFENGQWGAPVNFGPAVNTAYDEYRPILREPGRYKERLLIFSSNRPGGKGGFDLYMVGVPK